jgi:hypothetical protein
MGDISHFLVFILTFFKGKTADSFTCIKLIGKRTYWRDTSFLKLSSEANDSQQQPRPQGSSSRTTFSRTIRAHSILSASNLSSRHGSGYIVDINANEEERNALVTRFGAVNSFSSIGLLSADLRLRRAAVTSGTSGRSRTTNGKC